MTKKAKKIMTKKVKKILKNLFTFLATLPFITFYVLDIPDIYDRYFAKFPTSSSDKENKSDENDSRNSENTKEEDSPKTQDNKVIIDKILEQAEDTFNNEGYENAILVLKDAIKEYPNEDKLIENLKKYEDYKPIPISQFPQLKNTATGAEDKTYIDKYKEDKFNNKYLFSFSLSRGTVSYSLDGKYSLIKGTIACPKEISYNNFKKSSTISISVDGYKKFTSNSMEVDTNPQTFEVDLIGASIIEITWECEGANIWENWGYYATLFDTYFYK